MPGNQGGSNWGTTAADPQKGLMFVVGVNQVALLKLEDVRTRPAGRGGGGGAAAAVQAGMTVFQQNCQLCHGANLQGAAAGVPSLVGVTDRMAEDAMRAVIEAARFRVQVWDDVTVETTPTSPGVAAHSVQRLVMGDRLQTFAEPNHVSTIEHVAGLVVEQRARAAEVGAGIVD